MCDRTCPYCRSEKHFHQYGVIGTYVGCDKCGAALANRRDLEAANISMTEEEAEAWQADGSFVLVGAEATDPADDLVYGPNRWSLETTP